MEFFSGLFGNLRLLIKRVLGIPNLNPRDTVNLEGVGERLTGDPEVDQTSHKIDDSNHGSEIETKRSDEISN